MTTEDKAAAAPATEAGPDELSDFAKAPIAEQTWAIATGYEGSMRDQVSAYIQRVRGGDMGMLPAIAGTVVLAILFTFANEFFLTKANIANLITQTAALMMLAIALTFVIILTEIDLSAGITGGVGMGVFIILVNKHGWAWPLALIVALLVGVAIGLFIGYFVANIGIPSFVVTLGLFLGFQGLMLVMLGDAGTYQVQTPAIANIMNKSMPIWMGWVMAVAIIGIALLTGFYDRMRRIATGMPVRPISLLLIRVGFLALGTIFIVALLGQNRSGGIFPIRGVPIVVPIALAILWLGQAMLDRTRFGMHIYAVGGSPEAARRAGINVARVRIAAFIICSVLAVVAGLFTISQTGVVQSSTGRDIVLPGVGAAVVGGVSLFGGRGRLPQAAMGALLISMITNGLGLLGFSAGATFLVTGGVLILAATIDALSRKRSGSTSLART